MITCPRPFDQAGLVGKGFSCITYLDRVAQGTYDNTLYFRTRLEKAVSHGSSKKANVARPPGKTAESSTH